jgi:predicted aspartyl protease
MLAFERPTSQSQWAYTGGAARRGFPKGIGITHVKALVFNLSNPNQKIEIEFLMDSGAVYTVIPTRTLEFLGITPHSERIFTLADGRTVTWPVGNAGFAIAPRQGASVVVFGPDESPPLLGVATLEELGLGLDPVHKELITIPLPLFVCFPF